MSNLSPNQKKYYEKIANEHATWLARKIIEPIFIEAFLHGVKHGREDTTKELKKEELCKE